MARILLLVGLMALLAGLDLVGALLAKQYAERHVPVVLVLGAGTFVALFLVYTFALSLAQLSLVTMGWIVLLQVGLLAFDAGHAGLRLGPAQWAAVAAILALQCYLIVSTDQGRVEVAMPEAMPRASAGQSAQVAGEATVDAALAATARGHG